MDHSRTAVKQFLVYAEEPHGIKFVSDPSLLGGSLPVCDFAHRSSAGEEQCFYEG